MAIKRHRSICGCRLHAALKNKLCKLQSSTFVSEAVEQFWGLLEVKALISIFQAAGTIQIQILQGKVALECCDKGDIIFPKEKAFKPKCCYRLSQDIWREVLVLNHWKLSSGTTGNKILVLYEASIACFRHFGMTRKKWAQRWLGNEKGPTHWHGECGASAINPRAVIVATPPDHLS